MGRNENFRHKSKPPSASKPAQKRKLTTLRSANVPARTKQILCCIVAALAIFFYAGTYGHDFAYDDIAVVQGNRFVQRGFSGIGDILHTQYFEGYDPATNARAYRPVALVTYAIEYQFFGLNPHAFHAVNILIYALTAIVLLLALLKLLKNYHWSLAFVATILFVMHPVHAEVVANIKSRDELIGFLNFCVALAFLLVDLDDSKWWKKIVSYVFFFLAMASKETLITTVAIIPLILYFFRQMKISRIVRVTLPYAALFIIFLLARESVMPTEDSSITHMSYLDNPILAAKNSSEWAGTTIYTLGMYMKNLVLPYKLSADYSYNTIPVTGMNNPVALSWLLLYLFLTLVAIKGLRQKSILSFCILWFFITISIVSSIFIMSSNAYADRFLYTPSLSVCLAAAFGLYQFAAVSRDKLLNPSASAARKFFAVFALFCIVVLAGVKIISYVPVWKNDQVLFAYNVKVNPKSARMRFNYGGDMVNRATKIRDDALLQKKPMDTAQIFTLTRKGLDQLLKGKAIFPNDIMANIHEADAWILLGNIAEAEKDFRAALSVSKDNRFALNGLGGLLFNTGRYQEAAETWEKINPEMRSPGDYYNLSIAYGALGDQQKANYYKKLSGM
jgi:tetratricopeptide (TPR) repeat protein